MTGPYRWSRNPGYVGLIAFSPGVGVTADNAWVVPTVAVATFVLYRFVIVLEERHLDVRSGQAYRADRARVRRWL